jgi:uncharacterized protein (DUF2252 family)
MRRCARSEPWAYASFDGRLVFDINDFDETIRGLFEWDLKGMATSLLLAERTAGISHSIRESAVARFVGSCRKSIHKFATMLMLQLARYQIHRLEEAIADQDNLECRRAIHSDPVA